MDDQAVGRIVRGNPYCHPVAQDYPYVELSHPTRELSGNLLPGIELYNEMPTGLYVRYNPLCLCKIIASQSVPP